MALFVVIGGFNVMSSWIKRENVIIKKRLSGILLPYFMATIIYTAYSQHYLDVVVVLKHLLHFDASGPLYYVAVYMQLLLITPILISSLNWCCGENVIFKYILVWIVVLSICYMTVHYTNLFDIVLGGGNLFAGPWLFFWFLGMFLRKVDLHLSLDRLNMPGLICCFALLIVWQYLFIFRGLNLKLGSVFGGTQVIMTWANGLQSVLIFYWIKELTEFIKEKTGCVGKWLLLPIGFVGRHTLYVFLYHMLFLDFYRNYLEISHVVNKWLCLLFIIYGPIILEYIVLWLGGKFKDIMHGIKVDGVTL